MPITVTGLLKISGLNIKKLKTAKWGHPIDSKAIGIYFVSLSKDPSLNDNLIEQAPIDDAILKFWLNKVSTILIDKEPATISSLKNRLKSFWLSDENIIYIGQTESSNGLKGRINQYYNTELGERKPHAGGHWIKTLKNLDELYIHYLPTTNPEKFEKEIMQKFILQVSDTTRRKLYDFNLPIPFANLELERGNRKKHGVSKSKLGD